MDIIRFATAILLACSFIFTEEANAQRRNEAEAREIAFNYLKHNTRHTISKNTLKMASVASAGNTYLPFYVFNDEDSKDFVIVSGDERMRKILGYCSKGCYNVQTVPPALTELMESYAKQYDHLQASNKKKVIIVEDEYEPVEPMLTSVWGQGWPYYNNTPMYDGDHTLVGCLAMAIGQLMYYYKYPKVGKGKITYTSNTCNITSTCDFSQNKYYKWSYMVDDHYNNGNAMQNTYVSQFLYACGVSLGMDYTQNFSSAYYCDIPYALVNCFQYSPAATYADRNYFDSEEWYSLVINELHEGRPVIYSGQDSEVGGHCFLIDGMTSDALFHVNFGWYGNCDGYFSLDAIDPDYYEFDTDQTAILNIRPSGGTPAQVFYADDFVRTTTSTSAANSSSITFRLNKVWYYGSNACSFLPSTTFDGNIAFVKYDEVEGTYTVLWQEDVSGLKMWYGYNWYQHAILIKNLDMKIGECCLIIPAAISSDGIITPIRTLGGETNAIPVKRTSSSLYRFITMSQYYEDLETGISRVQTNVPKQKNIYNLSGHTLSVPTRGINIINGKKVYFK